MTIQDRLKVCMVKGNLTVADLARWFDRPDPTIRGWVNRGVKPNCPARDLAWLLAGLSTLEFMIKQKKGLPVPRMSQRERISYLAQLRG